MKVGILGGTFDPIHAGHLILAACAAQQLHLDRVLFIPAGAPWRKDAQDVTRASERLAMVRLAVAGDGRFQADDREIRREGPSYTVDTLRAMRDELGVAAKLHFLVGEDALEDMPYWHEAPELLRLARLGVAPRMDTPVPEPPHAHGGPPLELPPYDRIDMPYVGISSTDLRARVRRGESLRYLVPDAVDAYIREKGLYR